MKLNTLDITKDSADSIMKRAWQMDAAEYKSTAKQTMDSVRGDGRYEISVYGVQSNHITDFPIVAQSDSDAEVQAIKSLKQKGILKQAHDVKIKSVMTGSSWNFNNF